MCICTYVVGREEGVDLVDEGLALRFLLAPQRRQSGRRHHRVTCHQRHIRVTNVTHVSPTSNACHQHHKRVTNVTYVSPTSRDTTARHALRCQVYTSQVICKLRGTKLVGRKQTNVHTYVHIDVCANRTHERRTQVYDRCTCAYTKYACLHACMRTHTPT